LLIFNNCKQRCNISRLFVRSTSLYDNTDWSLYFQIDLETFSESDLHGAKEYFISVYISAVVVPIISNIIGNRLGECLHCLFSSIHSQNIILWAGSSVWYERSIRNREVAGSNPAQSTATIRKFWHTLMTKGTRC
jgi:hypothetical protein